MLARRLGIVRFKVETGCVHENASNPLTENGSSVTDACAESIGQVKNLRWLGIYNGDIRTDRFIEGISQHSKELEHIDLSSDKLAKPRADHVQRELPFEILLFTQID